MNKLLTVPKDSTARLVAGMPRWAQGLHNSDLVVLDTHGIAHRQHSYCFDRPDTKWARATTVVSALLTARLCRKCR